MTKEASCVFVLPANTGACALQQTSEAFFTTDMNDAF